MSPRRLRHQDAAAELDRADLAGVDGISPVGGLEAANHVCGGDRQGVGPVGQQAQLELIALAKRGARLGPLQFGALFRSELEDTAKTELLIVLTPHVITSPAELSRVQVLTDREINRLSLSDEEKAGLRRSRVIPGDRDSRDKDGSDDPGDSR